MPDASDHVVADLRGKHRSTRVAHRHPVNVVHFQEATRGERLADRTAGFIGSWPFLIGQTVLMTGWVIVNAVGIFALKWDPYPFIFLNLILSFQATYAGPVLLLAANRHAQKDRLTLEHAASESQAGGVRIREILVQITKNTELTNQILAELESSEPAPRGAAV